MSDKKDAGNDTSDVVEAVKEAPKKSFRDDDDDDVDDNNDGGKQPLKRLKTDVDYSAHSSLETFDENNRNGSNNNDNGNGNKRSARSSLSENDGCNNEKLNETDDSLTTSVFPPIGSSSPGICHRNNVSSEKEAEQLEQDSNINSSSLESTPFESKERWKVHQMAEDYVNFVGTIMYPATQFQPYGYNAQQREYPIEKISMLGFLKSPLRRPNIIERWSPYEIAIFEGSMLHFGKQFRDISRQIGTKTIREVIDFYYIWKKTDHYKKWKETFISDDELMDDYQLQPSGKKPKL